MRTVTVERSEIKRDTKDVVMWFPSVTPEIEPEVIDAIFNPVTKTFEPTLH